MGGTAQANDVALDSASTMSMNDLEAQSPTNRSRTGGNQNSRGGGGGGGNGHGGGGSGWHLPSSQEERANLILLEQLRLPLLKTRSLFSNDLA